MADFGSVFGSTATGAAGGSAFGVPGAIVGAGIGLVGGLLQSSAAQNISEAQLANQQRAAGYAAPTSEELGLMQNQLDQFSRYNNFLAGEYQRSYQLMESLQPGIMEASKQIYAGMRGETMAATLPMQRQIERGREALKAQMQQQFGAGWAGSSAGQAAMTAYNQQANEQLQAAQYQAMGQMAGLGQSLQSQYGTAANTVGYGQQVASGLLGQALTSRGNIQGRQISAITGVTPYAGAQYAGQYALGGQMGALGGTMTGLGILGMMSRPKAPGTPTGVSVGAGDGGYLPSQLGWQPQLPQGALPNFSF